MIEYTIIENKERDVLISDINKLLQAGWELHGPTSVFPYNTDIIYYYQALVKTITRGPYN